MAVVPPPLPPSARRTCDDWLVERVLGSGGMGRVYAVTHREFGKRAALKVCHATIDSGDFSARIFWREARIVQRVDHPGIPDIFAIGSYADRPYLVMERLAGETLRERIERGGFDRDLALELLADVCDALAAAHDARVIHGDLKLDNIFVLDKPIAGARIKLLDWGLARVDGEEDPLRGMLVGTPNYVAPEQVLGDPVSTASDVYSLGVIVFRVLLGQSPFTGANELDVVREHVFATPPDPAELWPGIPEELSHLIVAMLAKEPICRPALADVRRVLAAARTRRQRRRWPTLPLPRARRKRTGLMRPNIVSRVLFGAACAIAGAAAKIAA